MKLNLTKPLIFFDLETTGVNALEDRIVELSYIKVNPDGREESATMRMNPGRHIPEETTKIHGITDEDVAGEKTFAELAEKLLKIFTGCDIAGYNSNKFDIPLLMAEFDRAGYQFNMEDCRLIDVQTIFHKMEPRTLVAAYKYYCSKDLTAAHSAAADTRATYEVLKAQLDLYADKLPNDVDKLAEFSRQRKTADLAGRIAYNEKGEEVFNFGKHKGKTVAEVFTKEPSYYKWMLNGEFPIDTKNVITRIYEQLKGK
jgi:DNA polymerase-3 subunit epsilon